jgi:TatD DNase family protein
MFDCGVNLSSKQFSNYIPTLKTHSVETGLGGWISISNAENEWEQNLSYCRKYSDSEFTIKTTIGIHPHNARHATPSSWTLLESFVPNNNKIIAIGECGLDYNRMFSSKEVQMEVFIAQIELGAKYKLPLYLHERDAHNDFYNLLALYKAKYPNLNGLVHCFTGNLNQMKKYLDLGFYIGITGWLTDDRRNQDLVQAVKNLPLSKLIVETDSPFLIPHTYSKQWNTKRNQPDSIMQIVDKISEVTGKKKELIIKMSISNAKTLFNI